ncbi:L-aspartate oxidase [Bacillus sp. 7520-S]|nr:L-aspartate oxidase [Bacillus sp. 7520-S]
MKKKSVIIVGAGIAGLMAAHKLADKAEVSLLMKAGRLDSNSCMAQGGIAAAVGKTDHPTLHARDTFVAGSGFNSFNRAFELALQAPVIIKELDALGVPFEKAAGQYVLGHEGAHSKRRILHAYQDQTGLAVVETLWRTLSENVHVYENQYVLELIVKNQTIQGVRTVNHDFYGDSVIIATGGSGQLYENSSNEQGATGDGLMLAYRAGAVLKDLEFMQFHPTILKGKEPGLISEAVRGEGAYLVNRAGNRLMGEWAKGELEGRDVVAATLHKALQSGETVFLDARHLLDFLSRFPAIFKRLQRNGYDVRKDLIPIEPGAHFLCGGIETDRFGRTSVNGLYAIGEAACTGVHGANRLASNSLVEALVYGQAVAAALLADQQTKAGAVKPQPNTALVHGIPERSQLRKMMSAYAGIERDVYGLQIMADWLASFQHLPKKTVVHVDDLETGTLYELATLVVKAALLRTETRGTHRRSDYPSADEQWRKRSICFSVQNKAFVKTEEREYEPAQA